MSAIQPGSFLTLHYRLAGPDGSALVDTFDVPPATLTLGSGALAPAIEARLIGLPEGARESFELPPGAAFGERNTDLLQRVKLSLLHELGDPDAQYAVGDVVRFPTPDGAGAYAGVVREVGDGWLLFDFNHPLAGQPVRFDVHVVGVL
jgi:FKBP-type peptidyl-prolyl cis-trans isomerase SlpA